MFKGNSDSHTLRHSYLEHPVSARFVRVHVVDWHRHPSLRLEIVGHQGNFQIFDHRIPKKKDILPLLSKN